MTKLIIALVLCLAGVYTIAAAVRTDLPWSRRRVAAMALCRLAILAAVAAWCFDLHLSFHAGAEPVEMVLLVDRSASIAAEGQRAVGEWIERAEAAAAQSGSFLATREVGAEQGRSTPIAEALDAARYLFPGRGEKRILLLSDGRATARDPRAEIPRLQEEGVKVYAVPIAPLAGESLVADFKVPAAAWRGVPVPAEVTLQASAAGPCQLALLVDGKQEAQRQVKLAAGRAVVQMPVVFSSDGVHRLEVRARFAQDQLDWNNRAAALVDVPLAPRVIMISEVRPAGHPLRAVLETAGLQVRTVAPADLPPRLSCDCVILDNVAAKALGDARLQALEGFVRGGGGMVFSGGRRAYGAAGYRGTPLEPVFPVLLDPKKEYPPFALAVVLDNSWSMNEGLSSTIGKIDIAKEIAIAAADGLNQGDWLMLVSFDSEYHNIIPPTKVKDLEPAKYEISRIGAFGMTNILGGLTEAARTLKTIDAAYKHILLISDGKETETGTDYSLLLASLGKMRISLSTVGVGTSVNAKLLNTLAYAGNGRYHHTQSYREIPAVVLQEAKGPENQLLVEMPLAAKQREEDPALGGIDVAAMPPLLGYNRSRARLHAWTPLVISPKNEPLLARMRYGQGQVAAFLSSATPVWARDWIAAKPAEYVSFWRQMVFSVLGPPHRPLAPQVDYEEGRPVFDFTGPPDVPCTVSRLVGGQVVSKPGGPGPWRVTGDADAILVTARGKHNSGFAWSRTYGREFADPAQGEEMLKTLCSRTGGVFQPPPESLFAGSGSLALREIDPGAWLAAAAGLLIVELLLRRLPAVAGLWRRRGRRATALAACALLPWAAGHASAMEVARQGTRLIVTGTNFRYTWDTRRGGELAVVEQPGLAEGGWWLRGMTGGRDAAWQRVNSTFAWKSLDTIPALSFSTKRGSYYSGEATIAYANADRRAKIEIVKQSKDEVVFETLAAPKILENLRLPVPWKVKQRVRVFDSGVVLMRLELELPAGEVYELDWASLSVNLDDSLYKEPTAERQTRFQYGWAFPGEPQQTFNSYQPVIEELKHLPLDIDVKPELAVITHKPLLFGSAAYDMTHLKGSAANGYAECCLAEAKSLVGTKADFGSHLMVRPESGMSPVPTDVGSMRAQPCFGVSWNLFDGEVRGLSDPLKYENTLAFAVASRRRSSRPDAAADDRNVLLGARVYYARQTLPPADEVCRMAAEGCDTLLLGPAWRREPAATAAIVAAAHAAGIRVGAAVDLADIRTLVAGEDWFTRQFQKDRDGLLVSGADFLCNTLPEGRLDVLGEQVAVRYDGPFHANAASLAICMRALRRIVGPRGFLIGDPSPGEANLLSLAEFDLHVSEKPDAMRWCSPQDRCCRRYRAGAAWGPVVDSLPQPWIALAAMHADTPVILWPPKDKQHLAWWELCRRLPPGGVRIESDLIAAERRFTSSSENVHGTLFDGGGRMLLLLAAEKDDSARVRLMLPAFTAKTLDGKEVPSGGGMLDAGAFSAWQVKGFELSLPRQVAP